MNPATARTGRRDIAAGLVARAAPESTACMVAALRQMLEKPELQAEFTRRGMEIMLTSPQELATAIRADTQRRAPMVRASAATPTG